VVEVLVILDGASEPLRAGVPSSLEAAATPALDAVTSRGVLTRVRTVAPGLAAGSETAIPALLGWTPDGAVDRGAIEAAAWGVVVPNGSRAWRVDVRDADGARGCAALVDRAARALAADLPAHTVHPLSGHRLLVVGSQPLPASVSERPGIHVWPEGVVPPRILDETTTVVAARGAAAGIAMLMGARVVVPAGATGRPGSDLAAKAAAALAAIEAGSERVVVHVGAPDEAAHERDDVAKAAAIAQADRDVIAPLVAALRARGAGTMRVCPDHGCDPRTGLHDDAPVPCVTWTAGAEDFVDSLPTARLTERAVAASPVVDVDMLGWPAGEASSARGEVAA